MKIFCMIIIASVFFSCGDNLSPGYPALQVPPAYRSPSGEQGQILLSGPCTMVEFFHGEEDDEADWHWFIDIDSKVENELFQSMKNDPALENYKNYIELDTLDKMYAELMVTARHENTDDDEFFYPQDVDLPFMFQSCIDEHPFYNLALPEITIDQGLPKTDLSVYSKLVDKHAYIYLQGAFVNDAEHDFKPEIHPLDAIAFAMDENGEPLSITSASREMWPRKKITWRVCFFANSGFHRINNEEYLKKERTTIWYLDLPADVYGSTDAIDALRPPPVINIHEERRLLWMREGDFYYSDYGVKTQPTWEFAIDPKDDKKKLKITATMNKPDIWGGIVVTDYTVTVNFGPLENLRPPIMN